MSAAHTGGHNLRNYLILTTVVVGGIFVLLLMNGEQSSLGITSAVIENARNSSFGGIIGGGDGLTGAGVVSQPFLTTSSEVTFELSSDVIPAIEKTVDVKKLDINSRDLAASIKVNGDKLELSNVREIDLEIEDFVGRIGFDQYFLSLDGKARRLEINGIALASDREIEVSFEGLEYQSVNFEELQLDNVQFLSGFGKLEVATGLEYRLQEEQSVTIYNYLGELALDKGGSGNSTFVGSAFEGSSEGLDIIGEELNLNLR